MPRPLTFLFLEPFFGGSHRDFAEGLIAHTSHKIELMTLPGALLEMADARRRPLPFLQDQKSRRL